MKLYKEDHAHKHMTPPEPVQVHSVADCLEFCELLDSMKERATQSANASLLHGM